MTKRFNLEPLFARERWAQALYLKERAAVVDPNQTCAEEREGGELYETWVNSLPFAEENALRDRLAEDGIDEALFESIVLGKAKLDLAKAPFAWLTILQEAYEHFFDLEPPVFTNENYKLLTFCLPICARAFVKLEKRLASLRGHRMVFDSETAITAFSQILFKRLTAIAARAVIVFMHQEKKAHGFVGTTPEARFDSFLRSFNAPEKCIDLLLQYPLMARLLVECTEQWSEFCYEFLSRLQSDYDELQENFSQGKALGKFSGLKSVAGDSHNGGRCVLIAEFSSQITIVYKPRSLSIDTCFNQLQAWLNTYLPHTFRVLTVISKEGYGWVEYVHSQACTAVEEVELYYYRQGGLLALLHCLQATDFHYENIIAAGQHPVLVDLETLFHPLMPSCFSAKRAQEPQEYSIRSSGLVPVAPRKTGENGIAGLDISGMGGKPGQVLPQKTRVLKNRLTDDMVEVFEQQYSREQANRPKLQSEAAPAYAYLQSIGDGFKHVYSLLIKHRTDLLKEGGLIHAFAGVPIRVVIRDTATYGQVLSGLRHPDHLHNGLAVDYWLDKLRLGFHMMDRSNQRAKFEIESLRRGDIPIFNTRPNLRHVFVERDSKLAFFTYCTTMENVQTDLLAINEEKLTSILDELVESIRCLW